mmetsp:Transcript_18123/g.41937  ORF Transcript_18123/g.41937 Transcript_18123/m.41937 type:complete len:94 (-) Transcript_18123:1136-1417(-)
MSKKPVPRRKWRVQGRPTLSEDSQGRSSKRAKSRYKYHLSKVGLRPERTRRVLVENTRKGGGAVMTPPFGVNPVYLGDFLSGVPAPKKRPRWD